MCLCGRRKSSLLKLHALQITINIPRVFNNKAEVCSSVLFFWKLIFDLILLPTKFTLVMLPKLI